MKKTFIGNLIEDYKLVDGNPLVEKNPKWLHDDYVKFVRFAQWKIEQAGEGVLGFITNHSYLDNPTFRGMRQSLMNSFEQIYLVDLHGNSLKKEQCPDGSKDENVFDIRQGVAIGLFVKKAGLQQKVCHADLWGPRERKSNWLENTDVSTTKWTEIHPSSPFYLFVPRDEALLALYQQYPKVTEIFPTNCLGIQTHRDEFVIDVDKEKLVRRVRLFRDNNLSDEIIRETFSLEDNRDWKMSERRKAIIADDKWEEQITQILYRPFDVRWIFYHKDAIDFGRPEVMHHMLQSNLALIVGRAGHVVGPETWNLVYCGSEIIDGNVYYRGGGTVFPVYRYPKTNKNDLLSKLAKQHKTSNLNPDLLEAMKKAYNYSPTSDDIFRYIYAVLYAPGYRTKYAEFLKTDFPRVPFTKDQGLFKKVAAFGQRLVELHLLKSSELNKPICRFQGKGDNRVEKQIYSPKEKRVYINKTQYFEGVEPEVWEYQIGGYQVLDKWLKDRKKRILSTEDIKHYCRVVTALAKTIEVQAEIDQLYPEVEKETVVV